MERRNVVNDKAWARRDIGSGSVNNKKIKLKYCVYHIEGKKEDIGKIIILPGEELFVYFYLSINNTIA